MNRRSVGIGSEGEGGKRSGPRRGKGKSGGRQGGQEQGGRRETTDSKKRVGSFKGIYMVNKDWLVICYINRLVLK